MGWYEMPQINKSINEIPFYLTKKVAEGAGAEPGAVNLSRGQAGYLPPIELYEEAKRLITPKDKNFFRYDKVAGNPDLRKSIAKWYNDQFNFEVSHEQIAITVGGTGGIILSINALTNPGDQIIIPDPAYPFYTLFSKYGISNRDVKHVPIGKSRLTRALLEPALEENTKLVILTSPNNPNGVVYDETTLKDLVALAEEKDFFILYDENHFPELHDGNKHLPITLFDKKREYTVMLGSLSRFALQGERIGWAVLPKKPKGFTENFVAHSPFATTSAQKLAKFFFDNYDKLGYEKFFKAYTEKRDFFIPALSNIDGFECEKPEGTAYAFPNIIQFYEKNQEKLKELVKKEMEKRKQPQEEIDLALKYKSILVYKFLLYCIGVGCVPGIAYGPNSDDYLRFTFAVERGDVEKAVERLKDIPKHL